MQLFCRIDPACGLIVGHGGCELELKVVIVREGNVLRRRRAGLRLRSEMAQQGIILSGEENVKTYRFSEAGVSGLSKVQSRSRITNRSERKERVDKRTNVDMKSWNGGDCNGVEACWCERVDGRWVVWLKEKR